MTNVMCLGTFFEDYKDNYDVLRISTDLDFDKLHEYFTKKIGSINISVGSSSRFIHNL